MNSFMRFSFANFTTSAFLLSVIFLKFSKSAWSLWDSDTYSWVSPSCFSRSSLRDSISSSFLANSSRSSSYFSWRLSFSSTSFSFFFFAINSPYCLLKTLCNNSLQRITIFCTYNLVFRNLWTYRKMVHLLRVITPSFWNQILK